MSYNSTYSQTISDFISTFFLKYLQIIKLNNKLNRLEYFIILFDAIS